MYQKWNVYFTDVQNWLAAKYDVLLEKGRNELLGNGYTYF